MWMQAALLALVFPAAFGALQQAPAPLITVTGTVGEITDGSLQISTRIGTRIVRTGEHTEVRKGGRTYRGLAALRAGDAIAVRCPDTIAAGAEKLVAVRLTADVVTFRGILQDVAAGYIDVGPGSRSVRANVRRVRLSADTEYGGTRRLAIGQEVHIVGWDFGDGGIEATRIAVYNTDLPLRVERPRPERIRD